MPNDIAKLRRIMRTANLIHKEKPAVFTWRAALLSKSQALKYAWWFESFRKKLQSGTYRFTYFKTDGSIRDTIGTLCMDLIPEDKRPKGDMSDGAAREPNTGVFVYYDLYADGDCGGWRSFRIDNFIGFVEQVNV